MTTDAETLDLPFEEAIAFFRRKLNLKSASWAAVWQDAHTRAFTVAGALRDDLLADFRQAIDKAIATGTTLEEFRKDFDGIVKRHGWSYNGGRGWRTTVIYRTNLSTAYAAGRYQQMVDPDVLEHRPYWRYVHGGSRDARPEHQAWDGLVLPASDPWWKTHYPPNGWGCSCYVEAITERELLRSGKAEPDQAPPVETYAWTDPATGRTAEVPVGIDPGWAYNVGWAYLAGDAPF